MKYCRKKEERREGNTVKMFRTSKKISKVHDGVKLNAEGVKFFIENNTEHPFTLQQASGSTIKPFLKSTYSKPKKYLDSPKLQP